MRFPSLSVLKSFAFILLAVPTLLLTGTKGFAEAPLRIATEGAYPPFNYIDEDGKLAGFDVDIALAICEELNRRCEVNAVPWDDLLPRLAKGDYDAIIASMARTPEREKVADFTSYYYRSRSMFVGKPSTSFVQTKSGLEGLTIAAQTGTVQEEYLLNNFSGTTHLTTTKTTDDAFALLVGGHVDAVLSDGLTIFDFLQTDKGQRFDFIGSPLPATDPSSRACIAVRKGDTELVNLLEQTIKELRINGVYEKINAKYFPFSIY